MDAPPGGLGGYAGTAQKRLATALGHDLRPPAAPVPSPFASVPNAAREMQRVTAMQQSPELLQAHPAAAAPMGFSQPAAFRPMAAPMTQVAGAAAPPLRGMPADPRDELANKAAEVTVLRNRLQMMERENVRLVNEIATSKDQVPQSERLKKLGQELDKLQTEQRYLKQDLRSSEDERKKLQGSLQASQADLVATKQQAQQAVQQAMLQSQQQHAAAVVASAAAASAPATMAASQQTIPASAAMAAPTSTPATTPPAAVFVAPPVATASPVRASASQILLRELAAWEATSSSSSSSFPSSAAAPAAARQRRGLPPSSWVALRTATTQLADTAAASSSSTSSASGSLGRASASKICSGVESRSWLSVRGGARFVKVWFGLFPVCASELVAANDLAIFEALANALHASVLGASSPSAAKSQEAGGASGSESPRGAPAACVLELLGAIAETASHLRPDEGHVLMSLMKRPSLCALLTGPGLPAKGSLQLPALRVLRASLAAPLLCAAAHQAESSENPLLAASNLLIVPAAVMEGASAGEGSSLAEGADSQERQECRTAALEVFCRCLATAPSPDVVLRLRGASAASDDDIVDSVLQRIVLLCHHELMCLGVHGLQGGPWRDPALVRCAKRRLRNVELSLALLSRFVLHSVPWSLEGNTAKSEEHQLACEKACRAFGRTRPLLASIVDRVVRDYAQQPASSPYSMFLSAASTLRMLLAHADGCAAEPAAEPAAGVEQLAPPAPAASSTSRAQAAVSAAVAAFAKGVEAPAPAKAAKSAAASSAPAAQAVSAVAAALAAGGITKAAPVQQQRGSAAAAPAAPAAKQARIGAGPATRGGVAGFFGRAALPRTAATAEPMVVD
eukprot:TRINITY_DN10684_c0_g3_i1.p1 TRINITY_DN10684_c0_g3~~TRINITY_DN10684_c0_g3_i1.p1  ORF type:complete len:856 (-),score=231.07 TRINITY_DN10684_c0_g3_i1:154-2721(-)